MCILLGCSISLISFHRNRALVWRFSVADYSKTYLVLLYGVRYFSSIFNKFEFSRQIVVKVSNIKFDGIRPVETALIHGNRRTDGRAEMTRVIGAFRDYANAAKICFLSLFKFQWHSCLIIANESFVLEANEHHT